MLNPETVFNAFYFLSGPQMEAFFFLTAKHIMSRSGLQIDR
jgi:hypothetical protein